ncbi:MAG: NIPSNAP family protein [Acidobacteriota bacterium]
MILLKVSYRVRAHHILPFEQIFEQEIVPLIREHGLGFQGIWKSRVGNAGEFLELWQFEDLADFDRRWGALMGDERLLKIFERTGPMVEEENFSVFEPVGIRGDLTQRRKDAKGERKERVSE